MRRYWIACVTLALAIGIGTAASRPASAGPQSLTLDRLLDLLEDSGEWNCVQKVEGVLVASARVTGQDGDEPVSVTMNFTVQGDWCVANAAPEPWVRGATDLTPEAALSLLRTTGELVDGGWTLLGDGTLSYRMGWPVRAIRDAKDAGEFGNCAVFAAARCYWATAPLM